MLDFFRFFLFFEYLGGVEIDTKMAKIHKINHKPEYFCVIFTSLWKFENGDCYKRQPCTDDDFEVSLMLSKVHSQHSVLMFNNLEENKEPILYKMPNNKKMALRLVNTIVSMQKISCYW